MVLGLFLFPMAFAPSKHAQALPDPTTEFYVYDPSGTLSRRNEIVHPSSVNEQYELTEEKPQVVVAVVDSLQGETIEEVFCRPVRKVENWPGGCR